MNKTKRKILKQLYEDLETAREARKGFDENSWYHGYWSGRIDMTEKYIRLVELLKDA